MAHSRPCARSANKEKPPPPIGEAADYFLRPRDILVTLYAITSNISSTRSKL